MNGSKNWTRLASTFSFVSLIGIAGLAEPSAQERQNDVNSYLEDLNKRKIINVKPDEISAEDREKIQKLRNDFPGVQFVKLGHLPKYVALSADHMTFDCGKRELALTALNLKNYRDTLAEIYLNPFSSWPSHTVVAFNGYKPNGNDICAFVPNSDVAEARSIRFLRDAVTPDFKVDWNRAGQTPPSGTKDNNLATQQTIRLSEKTRLPLQLFDAGKLTCVVIEMPDTSAMMRLSDAPDGQWVPVIKNGELVRTPVPKTGAQTTSPQPTQ